MPRLPRSWAALLAITALVAVPAPPGVAQELSGLALGPDGGPLTGVPVVLHRVGGGGGAFVATDTTSSEGRFRFALEAADSAIYFVALRHEDRMYIGPAVQGAAAGNDYVLRVEPGSEAGAVASALSGQGPARPTSRPVAGTQRVRSDTGAFVLVALLALAGVAAFIVAAPRYRKRRTRDALVELATVENTLAELEGSEDRRRLVATRDRLRKQLAAGG